MINSITFKGVNSNSLKGLIVSELPPISRPQMRVKETVVDGVDGSIIENLGYSTHDRTARIGLSKGYDVDAVLKFFTGTGDVIFSNEPDKVYHASIISDIELERLLRYRTGSVTFRCQPYKYLYNEKETVGTASPVAVENKGLETSKPIITLKGSGIVELSVNGVGVCQYDFKDDTEVVIDSEQQDAYLGAILKNRQMIGEFPVLKSGNNEISWSGNLTEIRILPKSRWL